MHHLVNSGLYAKASEWSSTKVPKRPHLSIHGVVPTPPRGEKNFGQTSLHDSQGVHDAILQTRICGDIAFLHFGAEAVGILFQFGRWSLYQKPWFAIYTSRVCTKLGGGFPVSWFGLFDLHAPSVTPRVMRQDEFFHLLHIWYVLVCTCFSSHDPIDPAILAIPKSVHNGLSLHSYTQFTKQVEAKLFKTKKPILSSFFFFVLCLVSSVL
jgi:hypothetical protein